MNFIPLFVVGALAVIGLAAFALSLRSLLARLTASVLSLGVAAFCVFGFLAAFEPSSSPSWPWHVSYGILGIGSLATAVWLLVAGRRQEQLAGRAA